MRAQIMIKFDYLTNKEEILHAIHAPSKNGELSRVISMKEISMICGFDVLIE